jgi:hypothetical protein
MERAPQCSRNSENQNTTIEAQMQVSLTLIVPQEFLFCRYAKMFVQRNYSYCKLAMS